MNRQSRESQPTLQCIHPFPEQGTFPLCMLKHPFFVVYWARFIWIETPRNCWFPDHLPTKWLLTTWWMCLSVCEWVRPWFSHDTDGPPSEHDIFVLYCNISTVFICTQCPVELGQAVSSCFAEWKRFCWNRVCVPFAARFHRGSHIVSWAPAGIFMGIVELNCSNSFILEKKIKFSICAPSQTFQNKIECVQPQ